MRYVLELTGTAATIGFCSCEPAEPLAPEAAAAYLAEHPADEFMHKHLLRAVLAMDPPAVAALAAAQPDNAALGTVLAEAALARPELAPAAPAAPDPAATPLVDLRQEALADMPAHRAWSPLFAANLMDHIPLPAPPDAPAPPFDQAAIDAARSGFVSVADVLAHGAPQARPERPTTAQDAIRAAEAALAAAAVDLAPQMRHQMSLAPNGLTRQWRMHVDVRNGALDYSLSGTQTSFGRGLEFEPAQAALVMEICERYSSWASIGPEGALGYARPLPLTRARFSELGPDRALDPASLPLEAPYEDQPLHWLPAARPGGSEILVPAQFVFLFANLDEPALCSGLGSTGLGAGLCDERARVTALLEVIERDAESTTPFDPARCFRIRAAKRKLGRRLEEYDARGIQFFFEDITTGLGVPCYRAFAVGPEGQVMKGASAGLSGPDTCLSAMMEVPYPFPWGPPTRPAPEGLPVRTVEELPDFSQGSYAADLALLEAALTTSGRSPAYVDLTRADMRIPVCRAIVPGLELMADFDRHSRLSPRLFARLQGAAR